MESNILKSQNFNSLVIQIQILMEIKSMGCLLLVIWWISNQQLSLERNMFLLILPLKPNMLQHLKLQKNHLAWEHTWIFVGKTKDFNVSLYWQYFYNSIGQIPWSNQTFRHYVEAKTIHLTNYLISEQITDIFTKALRCEKFENFIMLLGMSDVPSD